MRLGFRCCSLVFGILSINCPIFFKLDGENRFFLPITARKFEVLREIIGEFLVFRVCGEGFIIMVK